MSSATTGSDNYLLVLNPPYLQAEELAPFLPSSEKVDTVNPFMMLVHPPPSALETVNSHYMGA